MKDRSRTCAHVTGLLAIALLLAPATPARADDDDFGFLKGASGKAYLPSLDLLEDLGVRYFRPELNWGDVEPEVPAGTLTVAEVKVNPALIDAYIATHDWSRFDALIDPLVARGIGPVAVVGLGYDSGLPRYGGRPANPNVLGRDNYLGRLYLYARATARRYRDDVVIWQIENELNEARLTALFGWRSPKLLDFTDGASLWGDFAFTTKVLATLADAVRAESRAPTMLNFHTDIHDAIHRNAGTGGLAGANTWTDAAVAWAPYLDIIGVDAYPNYYAADPVYAGDLGARIAKARSLLPGKPVIVVETGYSIPRSGAFPDPVDFSDEKQAEYLRGAIEGAVRAGAKGFFYFAVDSAGGSPPPGGYTELDLATLAALGPAFRKGDVPGLWAAIDAAGIPYLSTRLPEVLQAAEGFGVVRSDGTKRPGYHVIQEWFAKRIFHLDRGVNSIGVPVQPFPGYRAKDFLAASGATVLIHHDPATGRFAAVGPSDPADSPANVVLRGDAGYIVTAPAHVNLILDGAPWPPSLVAADPGPINAVALPRHPVASWRASDLVAATGASYILHYDSFKRTWKSWFPSFRAGDVELRGGTGYLLVNARRGVEIPGTPW